MHPYILGLRPVDSHLLRAARAIPSGKSYKYFTASLILLFGTLLSLSTHAQPTGFVDEVYLSGFNQALGMTYDESGRMYVWEKAGKVFVVDQGVKNPIPLIDISEEVGNWRDYGLLGVALHPNFLNNGYIYLLYVVDRHHLLNFGTPNYNPNASISFNATIGRLTRYTADVNGNLETVDYESRKVLIGETIDTGIPILHQSHGVGTVLFGDDGSLLVSTGDGASYSGEDVGGPVYASYAVQGLADGIISAKEDVGAYRSQLPDCLSGKILRIDPVTGDGLASNPFFDPLDPRGAKSRVWSLGLRNPFRMTLKPESGSHSMNDGNPGALYVGDVGWTDWEELNVVTGPGMNFGWPIYDGMEITTDYTAPFNEVDNLDAPNPLFDGSNCTAEYFSFHNLIKQATMDGNISFPNPCNPGVEIPDSVNGNPIYKFMHSRPAIDWGHTAVGPSRTGIFNGNVAAVVNIGAAGSPVSGPQFGGNSSTGGVWYTGDGFPLEYQNSYFHADYTTNGKWVKNFKFDVDDNPTAVHDFINDVEGVVALAVHPSDGALYYIKYSNEIHKVVYAPNGNLNPVAMATSDINFGSGPLQVSFNGSGSFDPEGMPLDYEWDFGDGTPVVNEVNPIHTFSAAPGVPTKYTVTLTVTDDQNKGNQTNLIVSVNNTPPQVSINLADTTYYVPIGEDILYSLTATVSDAEHTSNQLTYAWQTVLHHNIHVHPEPVDNNPTSSTLITPIGCGDEDYYYQLFLTITDEAGLYTTDSMYFLPDCTTGAGTGLVGTYFKGKSLSGDVLLTRVDPQIDFDWGPGSPDPLVPTGNFSVAWEGFVEAIYDEEYTFYAIADDGVRLYVNGQQLVDGWINQGPTEYNGTITLQAGQKYSLLMEYYEDGGGALAKLEWSSASQDREVIPERQLYVPGQGPTGLNPPVLSSIGNQVVTEGSIFGVTVSASDLDGSVSVLSVVGLPPQVGSFTDNGNGTGTLDLSPAIGQAGIYQVTITATDPTARFDDETITITVLDQSVGGGTGLLGTYYQGKNLDGAVLLTRVDPQIDFVWGSGSPDPVVPANKFSVHWEGWVQPLYSETYTFFTTGDDGIRLYVNGQLVIDGWINQAPTEYSGTVSLEVGQKYAIVLEYYEDGGGALAQMSWSSPTQSKELIPQSQLFEPSQGPAGVNAPVLAAIGNQLLAEGDIVSLPISATDLDQDVLIITQVGLPLNVGTLTDNGDGTATLALNPGTGAAGSYPVIITVTDITNRTDEETVTITILDPNTGGGTGLLGTYYRNKELIEPFTLTRVDPNVDFVWSSGERPDPSLGTNNFSIRWEGWVQPIYSETYTFYSTGDDGVRLFVDGQQITNGWVNQGPTEYSGTISLDAGQKYAIVLEYYEDGGGAQAQLSWSSPTQLKEIIPQSQLFEPSQGPAGVNAPVLAAIGNQLLAEGDIISLPISATDQDQDVLIITQVGLPPNVGTLTDNGDGTATLALNPATGAAGSYSVTITVTDITNRTDEETVTITILDPNTGGGTGLLGTYYRNKELIEPFTLTRIDPNVDFFWPSGARPDPSLGSNDFSIRWEGFVQPLYSEPYTFYTNTDDGGRLYVNGQQLVDQWVNQGPTERSGTLTLEVGQKYSIIMEYYENGGNATAQLLWSSPSQPKEIIPQNFLFEPGTPLQSSYNRLVDGYGAIEASHYLVYPNPVLDHVNIEFSLMEAETIDVLLLNSLGQLYDLGQFEMDKGRSIVKLKLDQFSLPPGLYYLKISSGQVSQKITKLYLSR